MLALVFLLFTVYMIKEQWEYIVENTSKIDTKQGNIVQNVGFI